jgi:hypothetical protein
LPKIRKFWSPCVCADRHCTYVAISEHIVTAQVELRVSRTSKNPLYLSFYISTRVTRWVGEKVAQIVAQPTLCQN